VPDRLPVAAPSSAVGAVYEGVNELESSNIPLLASPQGGVGCFMKKMSRSHRSRRSRGGFPFGFSRKTTPASLSAEASRHFVNRSATPYSFKMKVCSILIDRGRACGKCGKASCFFEAFPHLPQAVFFFFFGTFFFF